MTDKPKKDPAASKPRAAAKKRPAKKKQAAPERKKPEILTIAAAQAKHGTQQTAASTQNANPVDQNIQDNNSTTDRLRELKKFALRGVAENNLTLANLNKIHSDEKKRIDELCKNLTTAEAKQHQEQFAEDSEKLSQLTKRIEALRDKQQLFIDTYPQL